MGITMQRWIAVAVVMALGFASMASAATINYGNFGPIPPGISFLGVTESSSTDAVPLYGPPSPFLVGLDFDPMGFGSSSTSGSTDITDGQINFTISGHSSNTLVEIAALSLFEAGDYTLAGIGTTATSVFAGAILRATVTEINGLPVLGGPINLIPVNASVGFSLPGIAITQPWSLGLFLNIGAQLTGLGYGANDGATMVEIVIDNTLVSTSETGTVASIAKKEFRLDTVTGFVQVIPEPGALAFASMAIGALVIRRRRSDLVA